MSEADPRGSQPVSRDVLAEIGQRLVEALAPRQIHLFGSHAYGTPREESDIDLLVVLNKIESITDVARRGHGALFGLGLPIELHFIAAEKLERYGDVVGSFHRHVKAHARIVYAA